MEGEHMTHGGRIITGDCRDVLRRLASESVQCCVTSPPYWGLRDYGADGQIGKEESLAAYIGEIVAVFDGVRRCLKPDGVAWLNLGDRYLKDKNLCGLPWRVAFALQDDGWILRQDVVWAKTNPMPESVRDRCTKAHEFVFMLTKARRYYFDAAAISTRSKKGGDGGRFGGSKYGDSSSVYDQTKSGNRYQNSGRANRRSVWRMATASHKGAHCAVFPLALAERCILASTKRGDLVLDPFAGSGTTGAAAMTHGRRFVGVELNERYAESARARIAGVRPVLPFGGEE